MANKGAKEVYQKLFMEWCSAQQVNRGTQAAFSYALKSNGEVPLNLLEVALRENLTPLLFAEKLQDSGYDVTLVLSQLEAAELKDEEMKAEEHEENSVVIVPPSVAGLVSKPKLVIQRADSTAETATETAAQSDMEGAVFKTEDSPELATGESDPTGEVKVAPKRLVRPPAPGVAKSSPAITEPESKGPKAWIGAISDRFSDWRGGFGSNKAGSKSASEAKSGSLNRAANTNDKTVRSIVLAIVLAAVAIPLFVLIFNNTSNKYTTNGEQTGLGIEQQIVPLEGPPVAPNTVPLNTAGSIQKQGFLGKVQLFVVTTSLLIVFALIGDRWYNRQNSDAVYTIIITALTILFTFPQGLVWTIGAIVFLVLMFAFVWVVSTQGEGSDFTNLSAWALMVGGVGGLVVSKIATITNLFPSLQFTHVIPLVELTYYLQTLNLKDVYPTFIVDLFVFFGTGVAIFELLRKSEDGTSPIGPIISVIFGLLGYALFLHVFNLDAWISVLIGTLVAVGVSAGSISPAGRQLVPREWGNKSPFDGAMLLLGLLLSAVLIAGSNPWLIGF